MKINFYKVLILFAVMLMFQLSNAQRKNKVVHKRPAVVMNKPLQKKVIYRPIRKTVYRKAHVSYISLPRWGSVHTVLPQNYINLKLGRRIYYYDSGVYYMKHYADYVVVRPKKGLKIAVLPTGYRSVIVGKRTYFYYYGIFYVAANNEFVVVDAPKGAVVDALPDGYEIKTVGDNEYYLLNNVYYAEVEDAEIAGGIGYQVIGKQ